MRFRENAVAVLVQGQGVVPKISAQEAYEQSAKAQRVFEIGRKITGLNLAEICFGEQRDALEKTEVAQPASGAAQLAEYLFLKELGFEPDVGEGHSVGEIHLLAMANVITVEGMFKLLKARGAATAKANSDRPGMMAVARGIRLDQLETELKDLLATGRLKVANLNAMLQHMLSGDVDLIMAARGIIQRRSEEEEELKDAEIKRSRIPGAFHSEYHQKPARRRFKAAAKTIEYGPADFELMLNNGLYLSEVGTSNLPDYLVGQLGKQVLFHKSNQRLVDDGVRNFLELGDRPILSDIVLQDFAELVRIIKLTKAGAMNEAAAEN